MKISVYDTYVQREDGAIMHFDILVPDTQTEEKVIYGYGHDYISNKSFTTGELTSKECRFCHIEQATEAVLKDIEEKGYSIIEFENCS